MRKTKKIIIIYNTPATCEIRKDAKAEEAVKDSANALKTDLEKKNYDVKIFAISSPIEKIVKLISKEKPDAIFNLCEGLDGNPDLEMNMAGLWEILKIPYTGCTARTLALSQDKIKAKILAKNSGIRTPKYEIFQNINVKTSLKFPLIVKPPREDASIGITAKSFAKNQSELKRAIKETISRYGVPAMAEEYIDGREFNVAIFGCQNEQHILPPSEIEFNDLPKSAPKITTYEAKWDSNSDFYKKTESVCPAQISQKIATELKQITSKLYQIFEADSYARADFRMDSKGRIFFLEFNPNPDISPDAGFRKALDAAKIPFANFAEELIKIAIRRR